MFSKELGEIVFSAWISAYACIFPQVPFLLEIVNAIFWMFNLKHTIITNIPITCLWLALTGAIQVTPSTNFMFLAIAKTDLYSDLDLKVKQREMVVNMLVIASSLGKFLALCFRLGYFEYYCPSAIFSPPS